ncbi:unnamed protein product [Paramecium sonneborni]|uniref:Uncharacterized protein n=1 Tax=Paramecium sonneborni TaxID=65129 RepID=A0A8S1MMW9_9CILI|nr:unnamed protein product [Paramecium sonneborni]
MIQLTKEHLHDQNKKLTEENQRLELFVFSLQRQLQNLATFIERERFLQEQVDQLNLELGNLRRDNVNLQEVILSLQSQSNTNNIKNEKLLNEIETIKQFYEEQINTFSKENAKLQRQVKDFNNKQISNLQLSAAKLVEIGNKIDQKIGDQSHRRMLSNPIAQNPQGISKEIYQNLIQQLSNQSTDEKMLYTSQSKLKLQDSNTFSKLSQKQSKMPGFQAAQLDQPLPSVSNLIKK